MSIDKATVAKIATLARIRIPEEDQEALAGELSNILGWIEQLRPHGRLPLDTIEDD